MTALVKRRNVQKRCEREKQDLEEGARFCCPAIRILLRLLFTPVTKSFYFGRQPTSGHLHVPSAIKIWQITVTTVKRRFTAIFKGSTRLKSLLTQNNKQNDINKSSRLHLNTILNTISPAVNVLKIRLWVNLFRWNTNVFRKWNDVLVLTRIFFLLWQKEHRSNIEFLS